MHARSHSLITAARSCSNVSNFTRTSVEMEIHKLRFARHRPFESHRGTSRAGFRPDPSSVSGKHALSRKYLSHFSIFRILGFVSLFIKEPEVRCQASCSGLAFCARNSWTTSRELISVPARPDCCQTFSELTRESF